MTVTQWRIAPGTFTTIGCCESDRHLDGGAMLSFDWNGLVEYALIRCQECSHARNMTDEELSRWKVGGDPLRRDS